MAKDFSNWRVPKPPVDVQELRINIHWRAARLDDAGKEIEPERTEMNYHFSAVNEDGVPTSFSEQSGALDGYLTLTKKAAVDDLISWFLTKVRKVIKKGALPA